MSWSQMLYYTVADNVKLRQPLLSEEQAGKRLTCAIITNVMGQLSSGRSLEPIIARVMKSVIRYNQVRG